MTSKRKFHKTIVTIELLSESRIGETTLHGLVEEIDEGNVRAWQVSWAEPRKLSATQAVAALRAQGADPELFDLDESGEDI